MTETSKTDSSDGRVTYSVPEAAKILGIGLSLCRELVRGGEIPAKKLGKRFVIPRIAFERWLEQPNNLPERKKRLEAI